MKNIKKIIGYTLSIVLLVNSSTGISLAAELTAPEVACQDEKPDYNELLKGWNEIIEKNEDGKVNVRAYDEAFEALQEAHHDYVGCMFQFAEERILQSDGASQGGTLEAYTPNIDIIDWMAPDQACLTPDELKKVIQESAPNQMLAPVLDAHKAYKKNLNKIYAEFSTKGGITREREGSSKTLNGVQLLVAKDAALESMNRQIIMEVESSLVAIDMMFTSLKELRLSFVMHVHFQCTLKFLEKYRKALEDLREEIQPLPRQLEDASVTK